MAIRVLELGGSFFDMGYKHGFLYREAIRRFARERLRLSGEVAWTGRQASRSEILSLADACLAEHKSYCPELIEELEGMAMATGLSLRELIIVNGFTDFIDVVYNSPYRTDIPQRPLVAADNCTAFLIPNERSEDGLGFFGQTWDMHKSATPHVILLRGKPSKGPEFLCFSTVGCVGMIGMNEAGIAVGINNILGADGQVGLMWPFVIRKILAQDNLEAALACLTEAKLAGAHNYLLFDRHGKGYNVEAMSTYQHITELKDEAIVHTNHCLVAKAKGLERQRTPESLASSEARLKQGKKLLAKGDVSLEKLQKLTQAEHICVHPSEPMHVETCGAAIMRPASGDFWAVWGLPSENDYEHFSLGVSAGVSA
ncbi:MAG: C45 family peptidase [Deinococcales bacterium]